MNYRHAFHAGNFADCMKHALLMWLLRAIARKPAPFVVLDTHAGAGQYDLEAKPATRTSEWHSGIARLLKNPVVELADYIAVVRECGLYPGSPVLIRALLRPQDRLICCERHPEEYAALKCIMQGDARVSVHHRDAWEAMRGLLPPAERRGLVFIDPPYEAADEFSRLAGALREGHARFATGMFAAWYPIKHRAPVREFHATMRALRDVVVGELWLREPLDPARLNGCGLLLVNPPYRFETEALLILRALLSRLGAGEPGAGVSMERLSDE
jgi:23S rRNA (adenine2030-N6)-methyltransferase